ncbi:head maturation protease, ClpP-related [Marinobacterium aestuariivivens]|uniref:ATP-dependent Clp protease proteolytic subunit n=1 Tax=Marinobacterium aestuariivivens TaxID=1698799 RepID=A0ABW2A4Q9_9GAMM
MNMKANFPGTGGRKNSTATWFTAQAAGNGVGKVVIDKDIGSDWLPDWYNEEAGVQSARAFIDAIEAMGDLKEIHLDLNSRGGDFYAGVRIYNYLKNHKAKVHVRVTGIAASIASVILMAGDRREMATGTSVMLHKPSAGLDGFYNEQQLEDVITALGKLKGSMVDIYASTTGKTKAQLNDLLDQGDTYLSAEEALEWGFATHISGTASGQATAQARAFWAGMQAKTGKRPASRSPNHSKTPNRSAVYGQLNNPHAASWEAAFTRAKK